MKDEYSLENKLLSLKINVMKKILLFLGIILFSFYGCVDNPTGTLIDEEQLRTGEISRAGGDGKYDLLGYGYDITGEYCHHNSSKSLVIDINRFYQANPGRVVGSTNTGSHGEWFKGKTATNYLSSLTIKMDAKYKGLFFKGSFYFQDSSVDTYSAKYSFACYHLYIQHKKFFLNANVELLKQYLTSEFLEDIETQSSEYIVKFYGTHVLTNIILGARLELLYRSKIEEEDKMNIVHAGAATRILKIFNLNTSGSYESQKASMNSEEQIFYKTVGGDPSKALINMINVSSDNSTEINIKDWQNSSDATNVALINCDPETMIPIYEFVSDPAKKARLKLAVERYINGHSLTDVYEKVPLYGYYYNDRHNSEFRYEINPIPTGSGKYDYRFVGIKGYVYPPSCRPDDTVPLLGYYYNDGSNSEFRYETYEVTTGTGKYDYRFIGVKGYVYLPSYRPENTYPLYGYYYNDGSNSEFRYETYEVTTGTGKYDYRFVGIKCNLFLSPN